MKISVGPVCRSSVRRSCRHRLVNVGSRLFVGGLALARCWRFGASVSSEEPKPERGGRCANREDSIPLDERPPGRWKERLRADQWEIWTGANLLLHSLCDAILDNPGCHGDNHKQ